MNQQEAEQAAASLRSAFAALSIMARPQHGPVMGVSADEQTASEWKPTVYLDYDTHHQDKAGWDKKLADSTPASLRGGIRFEYAC